MDMEKNRALRCHWLVLQMFEHLAQSEPGTEMLWALWVGVAVD